MLHPHNGPEERLSDFARRKLGADLEDCVHIEHMPVHIVHGRYDLVCRPRMAWDLHKRLPRSTIELTWNSGHSTAEARTIDAIVRATDRFRNLNDPASEPK